MVTFTHLSKMGWALVSTDVFDCRSSGGAREDEGILLSGKGGLLLDGRDGMAGI